MPLPLALPVIVGGLVTGFFTVLATALPALILRAFFFIGIGYATITGVTAGYDTLLAYIQTNLSSLPFAVASMLKIAGFPTAMSYIFSALSFKLSLKLVNGTMTFFTNRPSNL